MWWWKVPFCDSVPALRPEDALIGELTFFLTSFRTLRFRYLTIQMLTLVQAGGLEYTPGEIRDLSHEVGPHWARVYRKPSDQCFTRKREPKTKSP